jgi:Fe-S-cluster-containing dehydrogenase component/DMSO reductase anchor subunit
MPPPSLLATLLDAQADLSAVERFAQRHERATEPALARHYRDLVPLSHPGAGEQYAFAVDLDACTGCKACVTACHNLNGLDAGESWRRVGTLVGATDAGAVLAPITMACHHCADPGCLRGCPVGAYEKDGATGIVRHLDDQCIGCQYCVMTCPYDVPQYSPSRGIVRKCDMCHGRLAVGEAPACVQACPNAAIRIEVVRTDVVPVVAIADAPGPGITRPTTRYRSRRAARAHWRAIDAEHATPAPLHAPLVVMLTATQLAVGLFCAALLAPAGTVLAPGLTGSAALLFGLVASLCHLGRPTRAWRAFLGLRTSWLSREIVALGATAAAAVAFMTSAWLLGARSLPTLALGAATAALGIGAVACSAMVYHATGRALWRFPETAAQFAGTTAVLGAAGYAMLIPSALAAGLAVAIVAAKTWGLLALVRSADGRRGLPIARTARLLRGTLRRTTALRVAAGLLGAGLLVTAPAVAGLAFAALLAGETLERVLFFRAVSPARMPGTL